MCDSPYIVKLDAPKYDRPNNRWIDSVPVPCGKCPPCRKRRVNQWAFRLKKELDRSAIASFVTLTYNTDHVPITPNGFMTLDKKDPQKFMKRLRKLHESHKGKQYIKSGPLHKYKIKYYTAGEYGDKRKRPHYHLIIFNAHPNDIRQAWQLGNVHIGPVNIATIVYTLKYMEKTSGKPYQFAKCDSIPQFSLMSKGLGDNYLTDNMVKYHKKNPERSYVLLDKIKVPLPRFYKAKIWTTEEEQLKYMLFVQKTVIAQENEKERVYKATNDSKNSYIEQQAYEKASRWNEFKSKQGKRIID